MGFLFRLIVLLMTSLPLRAQETTIWHDQAERVMFVSATLLDNLPIGEPRAGFHTLGISLTLSMLPEVNPTVGGKQEKVPASPVAAMPTLKGTYTFKKFKNWALAGRLYAGAVFPGAESILGINAKLTQYGFGGLALFEKNTGPLRTFFQVGIHYITTELFGSITSKDGCNLEFTDKDTSGCDFFDSTTFYSYAVMGVTHWKSKFFANLQLGVRSTDASFLITADATELKGSDISMEQGWPFATQGVVGWRWKTVQVALAELWVPNRILMPRLFGSYVFRF